MTIRDDILNHDDLPRQDVYIPEWEQTVYVRSMTGAERDQYEGELIEKKDAPMKERMRDMRATLVVLCTVDENGDRIFQDGDREKVGAKSSKALDRIVDAAQHVNALSDDSIEEMAGNSDPSGGVASISGSR